MVLRSFLSNQIPAILKSVPKCATLPLPIVRQLASAPSARLPLSDYKLFKLDCGPPCNTECTRDDALKYAKLMHRIRRMETAASNLYKEKKIRGFCHLYSGQEAVAVGIEAALQPGDYVITSYRCHAFIVSRGGEVSSVLAELTGRSTGAALGKGGSMHMFYDYFLGGNGIVGAQVPLGTGAGFAAKYRGTDGVSLVIYGDGAANQGQVFESYNLAKLLNLPCIFICENNKYGMGTSANRSSANAAYYTRGDYIPGIWVDGMDLLTVREAIQFAANWCRSGRGPILLEMETYRYYGHSMSDPGTSYRTRDEVQSVRRGRDPINLFAKKIVDAELVTEDELKEIEKAARQEVEKATEIALTSPVPAVSETYTQIYKLHPPNLPVRGCDVLTWATPK